MSFLNDHRAGRLGPMMLGTAQLGLDYGIANRDGKPDPQVAGAVLSAAWRAGVRVIDTAQGYGDSERVIGDWLRGHPEAPFHVVTKLLPTLDHRDAAAVVQAARDSIARLGRPLASLMLHAASELGAWRHGLGDGLRRCLEEGLAETLGASVYTPAEFRSALALPEITMIQAPFNVLDRRLLDEGLLDRALGSGRIVVLRSVFLQGLLLLDDEAVGRKLPFPAPLLATWRALCEGAGLAPSTVAAAWVRQVAPGAIVVIGCERPEQVSANVALLTQGRLPAEVAHAIAGLPPAEERLINPSLWRVP